MQNKRALVGAQHEMNFHQIKLNLSEMPCVLLIVLYLFTDSRAIFYIH